MNLRLPRDIELVDRLDQKPRLEVTTRVWRVVREGRNPIVGTSAKGRWDDGTFEVLYTSTEKNVAIEEIYFHLTRQPVFPSKLNLSIVEISIQTKRTLEFPTLASLSEFDITQDIYKSTDYSRCQEIADVSHFLGFDSILAPSARSKGSNLILFMNQIDQCEIEIVETNALNLEEWRRTR